MSHFASFRRESSSVTAQITWQSHLRCATTILLRRRDRHLPPVTGRMTSGTIMTHTQLAVPSNAAAPYIPRVVRNLCIAPVCHTFVQSQSHNTSKYPAGNTGLWLSCPLDKLLRKANGLKQSASIGPLRSKSLQVVSSSQPAPHRGRLIGSSQEMAFPASPPHRWILHRTVPASVFAACSCEGEACAAVSAA